MIRQEIKNLIEKTGAYDNLLREAKNSGFVGLRVEVKTPERKEHGDYTAKVYRINESGIDAFGVQSESWSNFSQEDYKRIILDAKKDSNFKKYFKDCEFVFPIFINFFLSKEYLQNQIGVILKQKKKFGDLKLSNNQKINVEFISANPTGPLHIGNARGGFCGDVLANVLEKAGYKVSREYYVNDMGRQILFLENSLNNKEPSYKNQYIEELKSKGEKNVKEAVEDIVGKINKTTDRMGIKFDQWFYESDLYKKKEIDKVFDFLKKKNLTYEKDGAVWFKSTEFGDDKDRVLVKKDDKETYFLSDIAYLKNKFERGFDYLIIFLGAEHYGYIGRLKAAAKTLGYDPEKVRPIIMQLVRIVEEGKELKMSKRTGTYITIDELIDEVGTDVSHFFFLTRSFGSHLVFDLDLAKEQSEKNPVFYIQYAFARICSVLRKAEGYKPKGANSELLNDPSELDLIKQMIRFSESEVIEDTVKDYQVRRIPQYALDLVRVFHKFYEECRVIDEKNPELTQARLALIKATQIVLKNTLDLMGISAPEKM